MEFDTQRIISENKLSDVIARYIDLKRDGDEYRALCPFHKEKTASFTICEIKGFYQCFGCGAHGDVIDFTRDINGTNFVGACEILGGTREPLKDWIPDKKELKIEEASVGIQDAPEPPDLGTAEKIRIWNPKRKQWSTVLPSMKFRYPDGGYVIRIDTGAGKKITPMIRWVSIQGRAACWAYVPFPRPRRLYREESLAQYKGQVIVVEGEKAADAGFQALSMAVVTWAGGAQAHKHTDFTPLAGKPVVLWGDADEPGAKAMVEIAKKLHALGCNIKLLPWDKQKKDGWDAADAVAEGWSKTEILSYLRENTHKFIPESQSGEVQEDSVGVVTGTVPHDSVQSGYPGTQEEPPELSQYEPPHTNEQTPFNILGYNDNKFYFLPKNSGQIFSASAGALANMANLFNLAPGFYWKTMYDTVNGASSRKIAEIAADNLVSAAHRKGIFRPRNVRGTGVWNEGNKYVIHAGNHLIIDNEEVNPYAYSSKYFYPLREAHFPKLIAPLKSSDASKLRKICTDISWESKLSGELLAGWIVLAPISGCLNWRPHVWIEGESESGKTTVINIIRKCLEGICLEFDGGTTEAAIRQSLGCDALPVVYDEGEAENQKDRMIMDGLLSLARRASSGGKMAKGGAGGEADNFIVRSCFCFAGINPAIRQRADESRISRLVIKKAQFEGADEFYKELKKRIHETLTPEFYNGLIARTIANLPILMHNITVFTDAAAAVLNARRAADQVGAMLGGLYLLTSTKEIDYDAAVAWIKQHDWTMHTAIAEDTDPQRLITYIATMTTRFNNIDVPIGTLIQRALSEDAALSHLRSMGIWPRWDGVLFANKSPPMERLLRDTPWVSWSRPLADIRGAKKMPSTIFAPALQQRGVLVPLEAFGLGDEGESVVGMVEQELEF